MTDTEPPIDPPPFDPSVARRAVRRGTWTIAVRVLAIALALFLIRGLVDLGMSAAYNDRQDHLRDTVMAGLHAAHPDLLLAQGATDQTGFGGARLRSSYRTAGPTGYFQGPSIPFELRESRHGEIDGIGFEDTDLTRASTSPPPAKADTFGLLDRLPPSRFLMSLELVSPLGEQEAIAFRQAHNICSSRFTGFETPSGHDWRKNAAIDANVRADDCPSHGNNTAELLGAYLDPQRLEEREALTGEHWGGRVTWGDPLLRTFSRWVDSLENDDDDQLLNYLGFPKKATLKKLADEPKAHGFALTRVTSERLRGLLADARVKGVVLVDADLDLRLISAPANR